MRKLQITSEKACSWCAKLCKMMDSQSPLFSPRSPPPLINDDFQSTVLFDYNKSYMPNSDSQPVKIKKYNFSQTPISCLPHNSCLNNANDIPSSSYGPSFIRAKQLNDIHKSGLLCKESLSNKAHSNSGSHNDRCPIDLNTIYCRSQKYIASKQPIKTYFIYEDLGLFVVICKAQKL